MKDITGTLQLGRLRGENNLIRLGYWTALLRGEATADASALSPHEQRLLSAARDPRSRLELIRDSLATEADQTGPAPLADDHSLLQAVTYLQALAYSVACTLQAEASALQADPQAPSPGLNLLQQADAWLILTLSIQISSMERDPAQWSAYWLSVILDVRPQDDPEMHRHRSPPSDEAELDGWTALYARRLQQLSQGG